MKIKKFNEKFESKEYVHIIKTYLNPAHIDIDDNGQAKIFTCENSEDENRMFIRIQSWDETKKHEEFNKFVGRKIKITIETVGGKEPYDEFWKLKGRE